MYSKPVPLTVSLRRGNARSESLTKGSLSDDSDSTLGSFRVRLDLGLRVSHHSQPRREASRPRSSKKERTIIFPLSVGHNAFILYFYFLRGKIPVRVTPPKFELTSQRQKVSRLPTTEPPGRPAMLLVELFSRGTSIGLHALLY